MTKRSYWVAGAALAMVGVAGLAQDVWTPEGWGLGRGAGTGLGRTEGPLKADIDQGNDAYTVAVTVVGCGGGRDFRAFGTEIDDEGQSRDAKTAVVRLLAEARRVCGFDERLAVRFVEGFEPAFAAWREEQAALDMNMIDMDMNAVECTAETCNAM